MYAAVRYGASIFTSASMYCEVNCEVVPSRSPILSLRGEWPSGLYSLRQVTEVKLGRVRSDFGWVTSEA